MRKSIKIIILVFAVLIVSGFVFWAVPRNEVGLLLEKEAIEKTALAYLNAEMKKDTETVYVLLAPSSDYRRTHSYPEYLKEITENPPLLIKEYKIIRIYRLRGNDNRKLYPDVDKLVQVEVEMTFAQTGPNTIYNYCFTFLKEKGTWYKG